MRYQNVYLLQVIHVIRDGGPWSSPVLDGILKEFEQQQEDGVFCFHFDVCLFLCESNRGNISFLPLCNPSVCSSVDRYLSSEVPMFFELRVRYLLACERIREAMALALKCSQHQTAGRLLYFKQAYLCCLWKSSQQERLFTEVWCVHALCSQLFHNDSIVR